MQPGCAGKAVPSEPSQLHQLQGKPEPPQASETPARDEQRLGFQGKPPQGLASWWGACLIVGQSWTKVPKS